MKRGVTHTVTRYASHGGYDFSKQQSWLWPLARRRSWQSGQRVVLGYETAKCRTYGRRVAMPGDTVWVVIFDEKKRRYKVVSDRIVDVFHFGPIYTTGYLVNYWLEHHYGNTGLLPMEDFWFTRKQAEVAMSRMLLSGHHRHMIAFCNEYLDAIRAGQPVDHLI